MKLREVIWATAISAFLTLMVWAKSQADLDVRIFKILIAVFVFFFYCVSIVILTIGKERRISLKRQTLIACGIAIFIAAMCDASPNEYVAAAVAGLIFGFFADMFLKHIRWPYL